LWYQWVVYKAHHPRIALASSLPFTLHRKIWKNLPKLPLQTKAPFSSAAAIVFKNMSSASELASASSTFSSRSQIPIQIYLTRSIISIIGITATLSEYYSTVTYCAPNNGPCAWNPATNTTTYQSLLGLGAALVNLILASIVLIAYFWGTGAADTWEDMRGMFEKACSTLKITVATAGAAVMFGTGGTSSNSLMGQSCNPGNQAETLITDFVNFSSLCNQQVNIINHSIFTRLTDRKLLLRC
jgi:hypothetical protein